MNTEQHAAMMSNQELAATPPQFEPAVMPNWFYFAKNGLIVTLGLAFVMSIVSFATGIVVLIDQDYNGDTSVAGISALFAIRSLLAIFTVGVAYFESRVCLYIVAVVSLSLYPIAMFALKFFVWEPGVAFVLVAVVAVWLVNRINKFCELNPDIPPGPRYLTKKVTGADGKVTEVFVTKTWYHLAGGSIYPLEVKIKIGRDW